MSDHLVILAHASQSVRARYEAELEARLDVPVDLAIVNAGPVSSAYDRLGDKLQRLAAMSGDPQALLAELVKHSKAPKRLDGYKTVTLASFSAGYALKRTILNDLGSSERLDAAVSIDSDHSGFDADGTARDSQLGGLVRFGLQAKERPKVLWLAHTDVRTPQAGPKRFASTTQVASELRRLTGLPGAGDDVSAGGLRVRAEDRYRRDHDEHVAALNEWGPVWLADSVAELLDRRDRLGVPVDDEPPTMVPDEPLGLRALQIAREEQVGGVREIPGGKHHAHILEYLAGCMRDGKRIGRWLTTDETPWCIAGASWCLFQGLVDGEIGPHRYRAAVREAWADAIEMGTARGASRIRRGEYELQIGDLVVLTRGGPAFGSGRDAFSRTEGKGHVGRVFATWNDGRYDSLEANVNDRWTDVTRHIGDATFVGAIAHPQLDQTAIMPADDELEGFVMLQHARLMQVSADVAAGNCGLDWAIEQLKQAV